MGKVAFGDLNNIEKDDFNIFDCICVLISFIILYEAILYGYGRKIRKISVKEVMLE